jgi:carbon monoxide dehydrogenase subunit G
VEQSGEYRMRAGREAVWQALNDPQVLAQCIEGCEAMTGTSDDGFEARVKARVGPVSATFTAVLKLTDIVEPESYTINANVKGGAAGFGKGAARVALAEDGAETVLRYEIKATVGGKLAQIGSRLIDGAARKMADDFFSSFRLMVDPQAAERDAAAAAAAASAPGEPAAAVRDRGPLVIWVIVFAALIVAAILVI